MAPILNCLEKAGLLVMTEEERFVPGRDIAAIQLVEVLDTVRTLHSGRLAVGVRGVAPALALLQQAETAMRLPLQNLSLKDLTSSS
jgi:hypothetical protein